MSFEVWAERPCRNCGHAHGEHSLHERTHYVENFVPGLGPSPTPYVFVGRCLRCSCGEKDYGGRDAFYFSPDCVGIYWAVAPIGRHFIV